MLFLNLYLKIESLHMCSISDNASSLPTFSLTSALAFVPILLRNSIRWFSFPVPSDEIDDSTSFFNDQSNKASASASGYGADADIEQESKLDTFGAECCSVLPCLILYLQNRIRRIQANGKYPSCFFSTRR